MSRHALLLVLVACVDRDVAQEQPCQARIYSYDAVVTIDETGRGCIELPAACGGDAYDDDQNQPGTQYSCTVSDVQNRDTANATEQLLPACDANASNAPCWRALHVASCAEAQVEVVRRAPPPDGNVVAAYCIGCLACVR